MKKSVLLLIAFLIVSLTSCSISNMNESQTAMAVQADSNGLPVQLAWAKIKIAGQISLVGKIEIDIFGTNRSLTVHYLDSTGIWNDVAATQERVWSAEKELWAFETPGKTYSYGVGEEIEFAICYTVDGVEYWDNNYGQNYLGQVGSPIHVYPGVFGKNQIVLDHAQFSTDGYFTVSALLSNLAYQKNVEVVYSYDDWNTWSAIAPLNYVLNFNVNDTELWDSPAFSIPAVAERLHFALVYHVNGVQYWDNNFGEDYIVERGSSLY